MNSEQRRGRVVRRMPRAVAGILLAFTPGAPLLAQTAQPVRLEVPPVIKYGKWTAAALAVGFTAMGIRTHNNADDAFRDLASYCRSRGYCSLGPDGRYQDPEAERRYRDVVNGDRWARTWLVGGQAALIGSVVLFVMELKRGRGPQNIPYSPLVVEPSRAGATRLGVRLRLPALSRPRPGP